MFLNNRRAMDLVPTIITALAVAALGLSFVARYSGGVKSAGTSINSGAGSLSGKLDSAVSAVQP
jgi:hypothetical protein